MNFNKKAEFLLIIQTWALLSFHGCFGDVVVFKMQKFQNSFLCFIDADLDNLVFEYIMLHQEVDSGSI